MDICIAALTGNLTKDPEVRETSSGKTVANLRIAVNTYGDKTSYFDLVVWERTAEIAGEYLSKGSAVAVSGRLEQREWEKDGQKRSSVELVVNDLKLPAKGGVAATAPAAELPF